MVNLGNVGKTIGKAIQEVEKSHALDKATGLLLPVQEVAKREAAAAAKAPDAAAVAAAKTDAAVEKAVRTGRGSDGQLYAAKPVEGTGGRAHVQAPRHAVDPAPVTAQRIEPTMGPLPTAPKPTPAPKPPAAAPKAAEPPAATPAQNGQAISVHVHLNGQTGHAAAEGAAAAPAAVAQAAKEPTRWEKLKGFVKNNAIAIPVGIAAAVGLGKAIPESWWPSLASEKYKQFTKEAEAGQAAAETGQKAASSAQASIDVENRLRSTIPSEHVAPAPQGSAQPAPAAVVPALSQEISSFFTTAGVKSGIPQTKADCVADVAKTASATALGKHNFETDPVQYGQWAKTFQEAAVQQVPKCSLNPVEEKKVQAITTSMVQQLTPEPR